MESDVEIIPFCSLGQKFVEGSFGDQMCQPCAYNASDTYSNSSTFFSEGSQS